MNRIILIGNGFDLAHNMPTSYQDFLHDFWSKTMKKGQEVQRNNGANRFENEEIIVEKIPLRWISEYSYSNFTKSLENYNSTLTFKNEFLKIITKKTYLQNWVDIENEYYLQLKKNLDNTAINKYDITDLNKDFCKIKELLREYLLRVENEFDKRQDTENRRIISTIGQKIYSPLKFKDFSEEAFNQEADDIYNRLKDSIEAIKVDKTIIDQLNEYEKRIINRIGTTDPYAQIKKLLLSDSGIGYLDLIPDETLFLNFNYTFTEYSYNKPDKFDNFSDEKETIPKTIHIHGTVEKRDNNPIIFGFGDELDDDYKSIERLNDNKYLENIKSIKYLETANYKKLLEFINSGNYQIFIMGHSCGISDRTLLNTMFEHSNCKSIKVFFHQLDEENDNFSDIIKNISRNFNDKTIMRDKVVNKSYCEPLI
jgi:hypothetical protein